MTLKANLIGSAAILVTGIYFVYDMTKTVEIEPCSLSFPPPVAMNLASSDGEALSPVEMQAMSQSQDWGVIEKASVERLENAPAKSVFKFMLSGGEVASERKQYTGVGFPWRPSTMPETSSVCFSYNVWLPGDFDFGGGGTLPGVSSMQSYGSDDEDEPVRRFRSHPIWSDKGRVSVLAFGPKTPRDDNLVVLRSDRALKPGRWHRIEQQIELNDPKQSNGSVRLWLDGKIAIDYQQVQLPREPGAWIETVLYQATYGIPVGLGSKLAKDSFIRLTPLEISWK